MSKRQSDDRLEILEKPVKKKQTSLNSHFSCYSSSNKPKNDSKTMKTSSSSSVLRFVKYKTVEENWIEKSLAPFDARIWLKYDKNGEYENMLYILMFTAKCVHNLESILKEYIILKKIELLNQPITPRPMQLITQESHIKTPWNIITNQLERHISRRVRNQQSIKGFG